MGNLIVGKHTLESLTAGMYADAKIIYREYIQNSVDAIDEAINAGIIGKDDAKVKINIDKENCVITIEDNGSGISVEDSTKRLLDIGNSKKDHHSNRGFRGIGRLAGLSYCNKLTFITSKKGEKKKSIVEFDGNKLRTLLIPSENNDYDLLKVITNITNYYITNEDMNEHYFKVILEEVRNIDHLLDEEYVLDYLSQVSPVPFNKEDFKWVEKIKNELNKYKLTIEEYNIFLNNKKIYKNYSSSFQADLRKKIEDHVNEIEVETIKDKNSEEILAFLWYTRSNYLGSIVDNNKKGIRLRKGNIQIGEKKTLDKIFKEDRFNGWFQGEVHVFGDKLIPNARRDDFEKNSAYLDLIERLKPFGNHLSKKIRQASKDRNELSKNRRLYEEIDCLVGTNKGKTNFKVLDLADNITNKEKIVLDKVFNIVTNNYSRKKANDFINGIIENY